VFRIVQRHAFLELFIGLLRDFGEVSKHRRQWRKVAIMQGVRVFTDSLRVCFEA